MRLRKLVEAEFTMTLNIEFTNLDKNITKKYIFDNLGTTVGHGGTQKGSVGTKIRAQLRILD